MCITSNSFALLCSVFFWQKQSLLYIYQICEEEGHVISQARLQLQVYHFGLTLALACIKHWSFFCALVTLIDGPGIPILLMFFHVAGYHSVCFGFAPFCLMFLLCHSGRFIEDRCLRFPLLLENLLICLHKFWIYPCVRQTPQ